MWRFWDHAIEPVLTAVRPKAIVEIGTEFGYHAVRLTNWAASRGAVVHVIDPSPQFDVEALRRQYPKAFVLHRSVSLKALPHIERPDAVLIEATTTGTRCFMNWQLIDRSNAKWPITFLHDVAWPYGRRDMYYAPKLVPPEYRQPYNRSGILERRSQLSPSGINGHLDNAAREGGPGNGVLTAIEDFIEESKRSLELFVAQGPNGLALLIDRNRLRTRIGDVARRIHDPELGERLSPGYVSRYFDSAYPERAGEQAAERAEGRLAL